MTWNKVKTDNGSPDLLVLNLATAMLVKIDTQVILVDGENYDPDEKDFFPLFGDDEDEEE